MTYALVPDDMGNASIVEVEKLLSRMDEGEAYDEAVTNSGIEYVTDLTGEGLRLALARIRRLNGGEGER